jgi:TonB family protein
MLLLGLRPGIAEDTVALKDRLTAAGKTTAIDEAGLNPWYLKIEVQLYDEKGKPSEQGTAEEWWAAPGRDKRVYNLPSYKATEVRKDGRVFRSQGTSYPPTMLEQLLQQVVHPMPQSTEILTSEPEIRKLNFGKVPLECLMLSQPIKGLKSLPIGLFPTYCFDPGKDSLRITYEFGTQLTVRNDIGRFQQKLVPIDVVVRSGELMMASGHVTALKGQAITGADLPTDGLIVERDQTVTLTREAMATKLLSRPDPKYPEGAKQRHISGTVVLHAIIGADGHIHKLNVVSSPDPELAVSSLAAVRKWTYTPHLEGRGRNPSRNKYYS